MQDHCEDKDLCLAYECLIRDVPEELLVVCEALGDECSTCPHRFS